MTFSLLARDADTGQLGIVSQSHYLGVGSVVTWAEAGVGVVATQAFALRSYGPRGLMLMQAGCAAGDALTRLLTEDAHREMRQVAFLDAQGHIGIHTGRRCVGANGAAVGDQAVAVGNMLDNDDVVPALLRGFEEAAGDLAHRLVAGLVSAAEAGGDIRGGQSAALLVVDGHTSDAPWDRVIRDLRVEDNTDPVGELARLVKLSAGFDRMSRVVFDPEGVVVGERRHFGPESQDFAAAAVQLAAADCAIDPNPEAAFWSAVLHARWGRAEEAQRLFAAACQTNSRLYRFLDYLCEAQILTSDEAATVRDGGQ